MKKAAVRTLVLLLVSCVVFCGTFTGAKAGEAPSSPDWRDLRGSKVYGQFNPDGASDGFMVMEAKSETCYGLMDHQVTGKNGWDGTCVYFKRDNSGAVESLAVLECEDGWIAKALTFSLNGDITFMDLATSCGLRFENKDGQYTVAEQASSTGWGSKQKISRDEIPVWVEDIFYTGVSVRVEEEKDGLLAVNNPGIVYTIYTLRVPADYDGAALAVDKDMVDEKWNRMDEYGNFLHTADPYADILTTDFGVKQTADDYYFIKIQDLIEAFKDR